jgi:hypothetical protein
MERNMLKRMFHGKRVFVVLAGSIAALLGVGLASADIRGGMADTLGDYYQARAGMAPVEAELEHPIPAAAPQTGDVEAEDPADEDPPVEEVEAKLEDEPEDDAEEVVEAAGGEKDDETQADTDDAQTDGDDDTDDDTDNKTSIPMPPGGDNDDTEADDDTGEDD